MKYYASCSFGKDSLATILLAKMHNEPLDAAIFVEVMFSNKEGISGEIPEHIEWVRGVAIPKLKDMGVETIVLRAEKDYLDHFHHVITKGKRIGQKHGFVIAGKCAANRDLKIRPIHDFYKSISEPITEYIGIAVDEPVRLARLSGNKVSLLAKYGYCEADAMELCREHGLLSPIYRIGSRGGCWFCPNARPRTAARFKEKHPDLWARLLELGKTPNLCSHSFTYGMTIEDFDNKLNKILSQKQLDII